MRKTREGGVEGEDVEASRASDSEEELESVRWVEGRLERGLRGRWSSGRSMSVVR